MVAMVPIAIATEFSFILLVHSLINQYLFSCGEQRFWGRVLVREKLQEPQALGQHSHCVHQVRQVFGLNGTAAGVQLYRTCV